MKKQIVMFFVLLAIILLVAAFNGTRLEPRSWHLEHDGQLVIAVPDKP